MPSDERLSEKPLPGAVASSPVTIQVVAFVVFVYVFWPALFQYLFLAVGFCPSPHDHIAFLAGPVAAKSAEQTVQYLPLMRLKLFADGLAFPLQAASVLWVLPRFAGIRLEQIGLTLRGFGRNCLWGVVVWAALNPLALALYSFIVYFYSFYDASAAGGVRDHPFVLLARQGLSPLEWVLLVFTATISAAAMEELLFRGALLAWLKRYPQAPHVAMTLAFLMSWPMKGEEVAAWSRGPGPFLLHFAPVLFFLALLPIYLVLHRRSRDLTAPAIFASSALFAAVHSFAWPSPVPLFVLALGLGWLAQRTHSLVGPIVLHGLFNAVSCVLLFWKWEA